MTRLVVESPLKLAQLANCVNGRAWIAARYPRLLAPGARCAMVDRQRDIL